MKPIPIAPLDVSYVLNSEMKRRKVEEIPVKTEPSITLFQNIRTYTLKKSNKPNFNLEKVSGFASLHKFNPQDLGLPK